MISKDGEKVEKMLAGSEKKSPLRFDGPALNVNTVVAHTNKNAAPCARSVN